MYANVRHIQRHASCQTVFRMSIRNIAWHNFGSAVKKTGCGVRFWLGQDPSAGFADPDDAGEAPPLADNDAWTAVALLAESAKPGVSAR